MKINTFLFNTIYFKYSIRFTFLSHITYLWQVYLSIEYLILNLFLESNIFLHMQIMVRYFEIPGLSLFAAPSYISDMFS